MESSKKSPSEVAKDIVARYYQLIEESQKDRLVELFMPECTMSHVNGYYSERASNRDEMNSIISMLNFRDISIETIFPQPSWNQGFFVEVTGSLKTELLCKRKFIQTFFLAPSDQTFLILNDFFCLLGEPDSESNSTDTDSKLAAVLDIISQPRKRESDESPDVNNNTLDSSTVPSEENTVDTDLGSASSNRDALDPDHVNGVNHTESINTEQETPSEESVASGANTTTAASDEDPKKPSFAEILKREAKLPPRQPADARTEGGLTEDGFELATPPPDYMSTGPQSPPAGRHRGYLAKPTQSKRERRGRQ